MEFRVPNQSTQRRYLGEWPQRGSLSGSHTQVEQWARVESMEGPEGVFEQGLGGRHLAVGPVRRAGGPDQSATGPGRLSPRRSSPRRSSRHATSSQRRSRASSR